MLSLLQKQQFSNSVNIFYYINFYTKKWTRRKRFQKISNLSNSKAQIVNLKKIRKYNPIFKKLNNFYYYINNFQNFKSNVNLKIINSKYGEKSYLLRDIKFPYVFSKNVFDDVIEKLYGVDEDIDIMNKIDKTFGNKEDLIIFAKM